jgi:hypothetical protein
LATLAMTVLLGSQCAAQNNSTSPAIVSCAGYDRLVADLGAIGQWCGDAGLGQRLQLLLLTLPQGDAAHGPMALDTARPWGAVRLAGKPEPISYVFLPVADMAPLLALIQGQLGCTVKAENGVYQIPFGRQALYAVHRRHWAFLADSRPGLEKVAADPETLLGDLPKRYDLAIHASIREVPAEYRRQLPRWLCLDEVDDLLLGWNVDYPTKSSYVDLELRAQTGTRLAAQLAQVKPGKSALVGLAMPNAAVTAIAAGMLSDAEVGQVNGHLAVLHLWAIEQLRSQGLAEATFQWASRLLAGIGDSLQRTVGQKKLDGGLAVRLDAAGGTLLAGASLADAARLETVFQHASEEIPRNDPVAKTMAMAAETYNGIHLHTIFLAVPDRQLAPLVGDRLEIVVGIADDKVLVAVGPGAAPAIKNAIDRLKSSGVGEVPPLKITMAVAPVARLLATVGEDPRLKASAAMLAGLFQNGDAKGCVTLSAQRSPRGVQLRLQVDEKVLGALIALGQMMGTYLPR